MTPPLHGLSNVNNTITGFAATDDAHAILAVPRAANANVVTLYATADGGASWAATTIAGYDTQHFSFLNSHQGWDESSLGAAMGAETVNVLRTLDGGVHWEMMSRGDGLAGSKGSPSALSAGCDKTGIAFENDTTGFATGACNNSAYSLETTHDAGRTWHVEELPLPPGVTKADMNTGAWGVQLERPIFNDTHGAGLVLSSIALNSYTFTHHDYVYFTTDGGVHWSIADPPLHGATWIQVVNATQWWAGDKATLTYTDDAGAHWKTIHSNRALAIDDLQFVSPTTGWALIGDVSRPEPLVETRDGGHTWQSVPLPSATPRH